MEPNQSLHYLAEGRLDALSLSILSQYPPSRRIRCCLSSHSDVLLYTCILGRPSMLSNELELTKIDVKAPEASGKSKVRYDG